MSKPNKSKRATLHREDYHLPGTAPATLVPPDNAYQGKPVITLLEYDADGVEERPIETIEQVFACRDNERVSWINIDGLSDAEMVRKLGEHFHLQPLALEDVLHTDQRPKVEDFENHIFVITHLFYCDDGHSLSSEQLSLFIAENCVITLQEFPGRDLFDPVRHRIRLGRGNARKLRADYLAYMILDAVVDHYFPVMEKIGEGIENLEDELLEVPTRESVRKLHDFKRNLTLLKRYAWPQREVMNALMREQTSVIHPATKVFLRDCYDHSVQIMDVIESYRDLTSSMMEVYLSSVGIRTNEVMKVLTIMSSIFVPLTFIVGVYGMNFEDMPELRSHIGYPAIWVVMILVASSLLFYFRRKGWI